MRLTKSPCLITGVRVGEIRVSLLQAPTLEVDFVLLRDPKRKQNAGINAGKYTKDKEWEPKIQEALENFTNALEECVLPELFDEPGDDRHKAHGAERHKDDEPDRLSFPGVPTLGDGGKNSSQL